jgi:hypothetical protein
MEGACAALALVGFTLNLKTECHSSETGSSDSILPLAVDLPSATLETTLTPHVNLKATSMHTQCTRANPRPGVAWQCPNRSRGAVGLLKRAARHGCVRGPSRISNARLACQRAH